MKESPRVVKKRKNVEVENNTQLESKFINLIDGKQLTWYRDDKIVRKNRLRKVIMEWEPPDIIKR